MWDQAIELGYEGPKTLPEWGSIGEYHLEETWPGVIPEKVKQMRMMYQHYATMSYGLARGKIGWWGAACAGPLGERQLRQRAVRSPRVWIVQPGAQEDLQSGGCAAQLGRPGSQDGDGWQCQVECDRGDDGRDEGVEFVQL